jgi:hypothetical protein
LLRNCCDQSYCTRVFRRQSYSSGTCTRSISSSCELDDEKVGPDCEKAEKTRVVNRNEAPAKIKLPLMKKTRFFYSGTRIASFEQKVVKMEGDHVWQ